MNNLSNKEYLPVITVNFKVNTYHVDNNTRLKPNYLTAFLQEAAWEHASHLDLGYEFMHQNGLAWMLMRIYCEMEEYPVWRDEITIETWPKGTEGLFFVRDMIIYNVASKRLGAATTYWMLVDIKNKRPRAPELHTKILIKNKDKHAIQTKLNKLKLPSKTEIGRIIPGISDIDINNHVNSNRYVEWVVNQIPELIQKDKVIRTFQMNYLNEVKLDEEIVINSFVDIQTNQILFEGLKDKETKTCFQAAVKIGS